jgi:hypothetical protein
MTKKSIFLSFIAALLATAYVCFFTDWFNKETIQIIPQIRPGRASSIPRDPGSAPVCLVSFAFDGKYKFTSVKVVAAGDLATNKYPTPLWHLVSDSNSVPIKAIVYGYPIKGMKPAVERTRPEPLEADVSYVLMVEAGKVRGQTNFHTARSF